MNGDGKPFSGKAIVLVVERDPHVRELERFFLDEAGFAVQFADNGLTALEIARAQVPDIIVSEILVPKMDGLALCRAIKSDPSLSSVAVLIFSILAAGSRAQEAGADAFLLKPLAERRLVETVRDLLLLRGKEHRLTPRARASVAQQSQAEKNG